MNELNIYAHLNYHKVIKAANLYFNGQYHWYKRKTVFAPEYGNYVISFNKYSIRICYWNEDSESGKRQVLFLKRFLEEILKNQTIGITKIGTSDLLSDLKNVKVI